VWCLKSIWRTLLDRLPARTNLAKRGLELTCNLYPFCNKNVEIEIGEHLYITCETAQRVGDSWIGVSSVRHQSVLNHFRSFYRVGCNKKSNAVWKGMWIAVWKIWLHRNKIVFKNGVVYIEKIFYLALIKGWSWAKHGNSG